MRRRFFILAAAAALITAGAAEARMHHPGRGHRIMPAGPGEDGPIAAFATPEMAYSLRKIRSGYTGTALLRLRRASDNAELDIGFLGFTSFTGAPIDLAAANSHCAATTCHVRTWYNQGTGGSTFDVIQLTTTNQPAFIFDCIGAQPCIRSTTVAMKLQSTGSYAMTDPKHSISAVGRRNSGTNACWFIAGSSGLQSSIRTLPGGTGSWLSGSTTSFITAAATEATMHAGFGSIDGAASVFRIDATETTGTAAGAVNTGIMTAAQGAGTTSCDTTEGIFWPGMAGDSTMRTAVTANQRAYWP